MMSLPVVPVIVLFPVVPAMAGVTEATPVTVIDPLPLAIVTWLVLLPNTIVSTSLTLTEPVVAVTVIEVPVVAWTISLLPPRVRAVTEPLPLLLRVNVSLLPVSVRRATSHVLAEPLFSVIASPLPFEALFGAARVFSRNLGVECAMEGAALVIAQ